MDAFEIRLGDEETVVLSYEVTPPKDHGAPSMERLTEAERAVATLAMRGMSNAHIASARGSRARTVANQLASLFKKLGVASRAELATILSTRDEPPDPR